LKTLHIEDATYSRRYILKTLYIEDTTFEDTTY